MVRAAASATRCWLGRRRLGRRFGRRWLGRHGLWRRRATAGDADGIIELLRRRGRHELRRLWSRTPGGRRRMRGCPAIHPNPRRFEIRVLRSNQLGAKQLLSEVLLPPRAARVLPADVLESKLRASCAASSSSTGSRSPPSAVRADTRSFNGASPLPSSRSTGSSPRLVPMRESASSCTDSRRTRRGGSS